MIFIIYGIIKKIFRYLCSGTFDSLFFLSHRDGDLHMQLFTMAGNING